MATAVGVLIFLILGCVAVFGYMTEVKAGDRYGRRAASASPNPQPAPPPAPAASTGTGRITGLGTGHDYACGRRSGTRTEAFLSSASPAAPGPAKRGVLLAMAVAVASIVVTSPAPALETLGYRTVRADGDFEIRDYPATVAAEVTRPGDRSASVRSAFGTLADYIFAKNRGGEKIPMTAPVTQMATPGVPTDATHSWSVRFLMPRGSTLASLPRPSGPVRLVEIPPETVAAVRFSGRWTDSNFASAEARLRAWIAGQGLRSAGPATYAYYDPPFKPWFLRHNEVLLPIAK